MPSSSSADARPTGDHRVPRKGGRTLTNRLIRVEPDRRSEIDLHYLGQALLRLAQEQYDLERAPTQRAAAQADGARQRAHEPRTGPNGPRRGVRRDTGTAAHTGRHEGAAG